MSKELTSMLQFKNATDSEVDLYFYGNIVSNWWGAWDNTDQYPDTIKRFLNSANGRKINIHINSGGGNVFAGIAIFNMIKNYSGETVCYIDGLAASIASVIALASDRVIMRQGSCFMIHKPSCYLEGQYDTNDLVKVAENLDAIQRCIVDIYKNHIKDSTNIDDVVELMNKETWFTSEEAAEYFNIELEALEAVAFQGDLKSYFNVPENVKNNVLQLKNEQKKVEKDKLQMQLDLLKLQVKI